MLIATHIQADILAEASQGALGDAHSHLRAACHKDVVLQHVLPYFQVIACLTIVLLGILALASLTCEVYLAPLGLFHALENRVSHIERIETCLGVDFEDAGIVVAKDIAGHIVFKDDVTFLIELHSYRSCGIDMLTKLVLHGIVAVKLLVEEAPASQGVAQVHVHHTPGSKHRLLVGIVKIGEDGGNLADAVFGVERVGLLHHLTDALGGTREDASVETLLQDVERLLGEPFGHELLPGGLVNNILVSEVVDGNLFACIIVDFSTIDQQRNTDGDTTEHRHTGTLLAVLLVALLLGFVGILFRVCPLLPQCWLGKVCPYPLYTARLGDEQIGEHLRRSAHHVRPVVIVGHGTTVVICLCRHGGTGRGDIR